MDTKSIIPETLKQFSYYESKLPTWLKQSYGFKEHFKLWCDFAFSENGLTNCEETILNFFRIFDKDYLDYINNISGELDTEHCDFLDKLGDLFGIKRRIRIDDEDIVLNNYEFMIYLRCQLIKSYFRGTRKELVDYYRNAGLDVILRSSGPAQLTAYLIGVADVEGVSTSNIPTLFEAGELAVVSMGVAQSWSVQTIDTILVWADGEDEPGTVWGDGTAPSGKKNGVWVI